MKAQRDKLRNIALEDLCYSYGSYEVLKKTNFKIRAGEIHAVVGEHGAGKSTLAHILSGYFQPSGGKVLLNGLTAVTLNRKKARELNIYYVSQQNPLVRDFKVWENIILDDSISVFPLQTRKGQIKKVSAFLESIGEDFDIDIEAPVRRLGLSDLVLVDILKALYKKPDFLIIDEALEKLNARTLKLVHSILKKRREKGMGIVFITHRIDDIFFFADRVSVIRDGYIFATEEADKIDRIALIKLAYTQITESLQYLTQQSFTELLKFNETILNDLPVNLILINNEEHVKLVNKQAARLFPRREGAGDSSLKALLGPDNEEMTGRLRPFFSRGLEKRFFNEELQTADGATLNNITLFPIKEGEKLIGTILIIEDISAYDELSKKIQLSENLASVGLLASGVAHEINNPLEIIHYYIENIRFNNSNPQITDSLINIEEEIRDISLILENLVALSPRNEQDRIQSFDLGETVRGIVQLINYEARKRNIVLKVREKEEDELIISANKLEIKQLLLNLLKNSFEAVKENGELEVRWESDTDDEESVHIRIADSGPGLPEKELQSIFLPFFTSKTGGKNLGMGLSICHSIVKKHKGSITARNRQNGGLSVHVSLPKNPGEL